MQERNVMENVEIPGPIVATEEVGTVQAEAVAELERRMAALESAMEELLTVRASATSGRKTLVTDAVLAKGASATEPGTVDEALRSLSVEQRITVKSGLMRAGLL